MGFFLKNFKLTSQLFKHTEKVTFGTIIKNFKFEDNKQLASYSPGIIMKRQVMFIQIQNHGSTAIWLLIQPWLAPARSQQEPDLQQELERHIHLSQLPGEESVVLQVPFHSSGWQCNPCFAFIKKNYILFPDYFSWIEHTHSLFKLNYCHYGGLGQGWRVFTGMSYYSLDINHQ